LLKKLVANSTDFAKFGRRKNLMIERTLSIIKPDGVAKNLIGAVLQRLEAEGLKIRALKMLHMTMHEARGFYIVHKDRPFYNSLTSFMSEGPAVVMVLEAENAISRLRRVMGATNPMNADPGTIRKDYAASLERNIILGSDSPESAAFEIKYFFSDLEIV
jgi:nucleoside-diphosphate kinase